MGETEASELLIHRMATDVELFAILLFPHYCEMEFNQFHLDMFAAFKFGERKIRRVRAAPRGSAKSTIVTLIRPIHDLCYGNEKFILFVSSTEVLANKKLKDIRAEILSNTDLQDWFGVRFDTKKVAESNFTALSDMGECHFAASGKGSQIRGIRYKQWRPSKLIFDDFESSDETANDLLRRKTEDIYKEEFGKTGNQFTNIDFVGTVLHKDALLPNLINNPAYDAALYKSVISWAEREDLWNDWRKIYRNLDNKNRVNEAMTFFLERKDEMLRGTKVLWPEKEDYYALMLDYEEIGKRAFYKERQNDPLGNDEQIFENIHWYHEHNDGIVIESNDKFVPFSSFNRTAVGAIDPSTGQTKAKAGKLGDFSVILTGFKYDSRLLVHHDWTKRAAPTKYIQEIFNLHERFKYNKFSVETNLYRGLLLPNLVDERKRRESKGKELIQLPFYDVVQTENKHERIHRLEPKVNHGYALFNRALSKDFKDMLEGYPFHTNDDGPDCVEILWNTVNNVYKASPISLDNMAV